jgi:hypothetical protein
MYFVFQLASLLGISNDADVSEAYTQATFVRRKRGM